MILIGIISHILIFYFGYHFGKRVDRWKKNHPKKRNTL